MMILSSCARDPVVRLTRLGVVGADDEDAELHIDGQFSLPLTQLRDAWTATLPAAMAAH